MSKRGAVYLGAIPDVIGEALEYQRKYDSRIAPRAHQQLGGSRVGKLASAVGLTVGYRLGAGGEGHCKICASVTVGDRKIVDAVHLVTVGVDALRRTQQGILQYMSVYHNIHTFPFCEVQVYYDAFSI